MSETVVVFGDALLDVDLDGHVERLAPDAPVPVVDDASRSARPGGAALAAAMLARDGRQVVLSAVFGADEAGEELRALLVAAGVEVVGGLARGGTPSKTRVRADGRALLRMDAGLGAPAVLPDDLASLVAVADAVLVSDYGRGFVNARPVRSALAAADVPVVWDPHPRGPVPVPGATVTTPNRTELFQRVSARPSTPAALLADITRAGTELCHMWSAGATAVTIGAGGAVLIRPDAVPLVVPAVEVVGADACGAGDRFATACAAALGAGALLPEAVATAVSAASAFVRAGGVRSLGPPERSRASGVSASDAAKLVADVRARGGTVVATSGCFDLLHAGHVASLRAARALGDCLIVGLNSDVSTGRLKGPGRPIVREADRAAVLAGLACVDAVELFDAPTPAALLARIRPDVFVKGGDYRVEDLPEALLLASWGGQAVVVPYLDGRSTTRLVEEMRNDG